MSAFAAGLGISVADLTGLDGTLIEVAVTALAAGVAGTITAYGLIRHQSNRPGLALERAQALIDAAPMAVALLHADGSIRHGNALCKLLLDPDADLERPCDLVPDSDRRAMLGLLRTNGRVDAYCYPVPRPDGSSIWVEESWILLDLGNETGILAWSADVTARKRAEESLRASERRLRAILDDSPVAVLISRPGGRIIYANPKAAGVLGLPRALLIGSDGRAFYTDAAAQARFKDILGTGGAVFNEEIEIQAADGVRRYVLFTLLPMEFDDAPARLAWAYDITGRRRAEEELRASEARLRTIMEASPLAMAVLGSRNRFLFTNAAFGEQFGLDKADTATLRPLDLIADEDVARSLQNDLRHNRRLRGIEARMTRKDGSAFWALLSFDLGFFEGSRVIFAWAADISERKMTEAALAQNRDELANAVEKATAELNLVNRHLSRELGERRLAEVRIARGRAYLRAVLDTVADGIITIDTNGIVEDFNPAAERIFGRGREEVLNQNVSLLMPPDIASAHNSYVDRHMSGAPQSRIMGRGREVTGRRKDGTLFPLYLAVSKTEIEGRTVFTGVLRDITEEKVAEAALLAAKEEAEIANRSKSEFLANMSHELRTPLNAIIGFSEMMQGEFLGPLGTPTYHEYVGSIIDSGRHLLHVINDILDIARIEAGRMTLDEELVNIADVVASCRQLVEPRVASSGLRLVIDLPPRLPDVWGDGRRLKQILLNLLSNAIKFTPENGTITVSTSIDDAGLALIVTDTGIGMSQEDAQNAIRPFIQVHTGLGRRFEGTGLGLPLVVAMAEVHGGSLTLKTAPDEGTQAIVRLPKDRLRNRNDALQDTLPTA